MYFAVIPTSTPSTITSSSFTSSTYATATIPPPDRMFSICFMSICYVDNAKNQNSCSYALPG